MPTPAPALAALARFDQDLAHFRDYRAQLTHLAECPLPDLVDAATAMPERYAHIMQLLSRFALDTLDLETACLSSTSSSSSS